MVTKKKTTTATKASPDSLSGGPAGQHPKEAFPIVGVGASAGGLEAYEKFFSAIEEGLGAAFVIVSHLDPNHASILPELIQRKTTMKVNQVEDKMEVVPNQVFIIPPNREMTVSGGKLRLVEMPKPRGATLPIDQFFRSLARDRGDKAIGIILSGTGTDGTLGIRAIKGEGGMVMAQDMESAQHDGMPRSAIATGLVDYILAPEKMPAQLVKFLKYQSKRYPATAEEYDAATLSSLQKILVLLRSATGHDFSLYKKNTIYRRIERRMHVHQIDRIGDYVRYLKESDQEASVLFKELLIGVTSFFRDPDAFKSLNRELFDLLKSKPGDYPVRIWVPGCSSGEEVYSVAIIVHESMERIGRRFSVQIFGTDLDSDAIAIARAGIYPESISADISSTRLRKYFTRDGNSYKVNKNIREMVIFAPQNIIKDPPFTKLDLLCCRNLLIYFGPELQKKMLPLFHYSLKPGGLLFLGTSETISQAGDLFLPLDKKWKIFKKQPSDRASQPLQVFTPGGLVAETPEEFSPKPAKEVEEINPLKLLKTIISQGDMSTCVVIDDRGNILYVHGRTGFFLEPAEGEANLNIVDMARTGLKAGIAGAIRNMAAKRQEIVVKDLQVQTNDGNMNLNLIFRPLPGLQKGKRGLVLVIFDSSPPEEKEEPVKSGKTKRSTTNEKLKNLEQELKYTKESLQTTIEELETSNEELKSANEELQSTNEELQSTNEELETSKEELQSLNEESATVNSELQGRIDELVTANDDMKNLLDATEIATIFLDIDLNIRRFTPKATELIPLTTIDIGRPITHFATSLKEIDLVGYAGEVLKDLKIQEVEVGDTAGRTYRMRVRPYRTVDNVIDGVVIIFDDISKLKQLARAQRMEAIVRDSSDAIILYDLAGNILAWNSGAIRIYGYSEAEALKLNIIDIVPPDKKVGARAFLAGLKEKATVESVVTERLGKNGKVVEVWLTGTVLMDENGAPESIATTERDLGILNREALQQLTSSHHDR